MGYGLNLYHRITTLCVRIYIIILFHCKKSETLYFAFFCLLMEMPPLCTAGFGLATLNFTFMAGA